MHEMQEYKPNPRTVVVIHFFSERTDGVSLQIKESARILSSLGWKVIECSADATGEDSFVLPELDYATPQVQALKIGEKGGLRDEVKIVRDFESQVQAIKKGLREKLGLRENDIVIGMMTRIIPRKAIEVAMQFLSALQDRKREVLGEKRGIHGRTITVETRFVLLLAQAAGLDEPENAAYFQKLRQYAGVLGVELLYVGEKVVADSVYAGQPDRIPFYSLYSEMDILTFPSYQEGFGNQYLEAVALGKGVVVCHEYPVMEADILPLVAPDGIISLGNNSQYTRDEAELIRLQRDMLQAAVDREVHFLLHPEEEKPIVARVYMSLKSAYDAWVVGNRLADILTRSSPHAF